MAQIYDACDDSLDVAREFAYRYLAAALTDPRHRGDAAVFQRRMTALLAPMVETLREEYGSGPSSLGDGELPTDELSATELVTTFSACEANLAAEYDRVFGLQTIRDCPPYETEFLPNPEPFFRSQQMADIAGFYRAFELKPSQFAHERPDHAALELEFMAFVLLKRRMAAEQDCVGSNRDAIDVCDDILSKFFESHIDWWLPAFGRLLEVRDPDGYFGKVGRFLSAFLAGERQLLGVEPSRLCPAPKATEEPDGCEGCTVQIEGLKA